MPGMFCELIVTIHSGTAIANMAPVSHCGATKLRLGAALDRSRRPNTPRTAITTNAANSAPMTAHRRASAVSTNQVRITGPIAQGSASTADTGSMTSCNSTPASIADASGVGIDSTRRPSGRMSPQSASRMPQTMNAPTAEANPPCGAAAAASSAAPGVDHAMVTGIFRRQLNSTHPRPIVRQSAMSPEAACACDAPTARSPVSTTANEEVKPTSPQTMPAMTVGMTEVVTGCVVLELMGRQRRSRSPTLEDPSSSASHGPGCDLAQA